VKHRYRWALSTAVASAIVVSGAVSAQASAASPYSGTYTTLGSLPTIGTKAIRTGNIVAMWQNVLYDSGFISKCASQASNAIDGVFGSGTAAATKAWQATRGLSADGVVGPKTWAALWKETGLNPSHQSPPGIDYSYFGGVDFTNFERMPPNSDVLPAGWVWTFSSASNPGAPEGSFRISWPSTTVHTC